MIVKPLRFHPSVQLDIDQAMGHYASISEALAEGFWIELQGAFENVKSAPGAHHFDENN